MLKKSILVSGLLLSGLFSSQISLKESFEGFYNPWANSEMTGPVFVSSQQYFCEGNMQNLQTIEPIPAGMDWGYLTLQYSIDGGTTWDDVQNFDYSNFTSSVACTPITVSIPASKMGSGDTGFLLKFKANFATSYHGILMVVIDDLNLQQESTLSSSEVETSGVKLFPNPAQDFINFTGKTDSVKSVKVFSPDGKMVISEDVKNNRLDISKLKPAVYMLRTSGADGEKTFKIIKK